MQRQHMCMCAAPARTGVRVGLAGLIGLALLASVISLDISRASPPDLGPDRPQAASPGAVLFIENTGQFAPAARFQAWGGAETVWLAEDAIWLTRLANVRVTFPGANPHPALRPTNRLAAQVSYLLGNDPDAWRSGLPVWSGVRYENLYPGITLDVSAGPGGLLLRFRADPGADLGHGHMRVEGAQAFVTDGGDLLISPATGDAGPDAQAEAATEIDLPETREVAYEIRWPDAALVSGTPASGAPETGQGLAAPSYATYLGGLAADEAFGVAMDGAGATYVAGYTRSSDFPTQTGVFDRTLGGSRDVFVAKLSSSGGLTYATFLGGAAADWGFDIAVDSGGSACITGHTSSTDFPVTANAADATHNGGNDVFLARLNPAGSQLLYGTYLGGSVDEGGYALALDAAGAAYIAGGTDSTNFPTSSAGFDRSHNGNRDAFVAKINPAANPSLVYSTFLGGADHDEAEDIAVDSAGTAIVVGGTSSAGFPVVNAWDATYNGVRDAFLVKVAPGGSTLNASTFIGGSDSEGGNGVALDASGNIYVSGGSRSTNFPTTGGVFGRTLAGGEDAFIAAFNPDGRSARYLTLFGGTGNEGSPRIALDGARSAYIAGRTESANLPVSANASDPFYNGLIDAYLAVINANGSLLSYSTYLGGSGLDAANDLKLDAANHAHLSGLTQSTNFPVTAGAADISYGGSGDVFVAELVAPAEPITPTPTPRPGSGRIYLPLLLRQAPGGLAAPVLAAIAPPEDNPAYPVRWSTAAGATSYVLERATSPAFGDAVQVYTGPATETIAASAGITVHHYRVKARGAAGDSAWSNVQAVEVRWELEPNDLWDKGAGGPLVSGQDYYGYPNDSSDYFYLYVNQAGSMTLQLRGHSGQGVQTVVYAGPPPQDGNPVICAGSPDCEKTFPVSAGQYYIRIYAESGHNAAAPYTLRVTYP